MSKEQNFKTLKNNIKSWRGKIFEKGQMRKFIIFLSFYFHKPGILLCVRIILVKLSKNKNFGMKRYLINALSMDDNIHFKMYEITFYSKDFFGKIYSSSSHAK